MGTCVMSYQDAAIILGCKRKKATNELESLKKSGFIEYQVSQGKHGFEVKLNYYYQVAPEKGQVKSAKEQVKAQVEISVSNAWEDSQKGKLAGKLVGSNTIQSNKIEDNEIQDNEELSFFNIPVPDDFIKKYGLGNVSRRILMLTSQYLKKSPPRNPLGLLREALENKYAPSDAFLEQEKQQKYGFPTTKRSGTEFENPFKEMKI